MGPLGIKPPRMRVALIAVLAALAAMAVASPGVASAAPSVSVLCQPASVDLGQHTQCLARVNTGIAGTPAGGRVTFVKSSGPAVDLGTGSCQVEPDSGSTGGCSLPISGQVEGKVNLLALYSQTGVGLASTTASFTIASKAEVRCAHAQLVVDESTTCRIVIPEVPNSFAGPTGVVEWSVAGQHPLGEIDPECILQPSPEGASCSVTFTPVTSGDREVVAEYKGDPAGHPARTSSRVIEVLPGYETHTHVECESSEPVTFSRPKCRAVVLVPGPKGPVPTGIVTLEVQKPAFGRLPDGASCVLKPTGGPFHETDCNFRYEPRLTGFSPLTAVYQGGPHLARSSGDFNFALLGEGEITFTKLACTQSLELSEVGNCVITVIDSGSDGKVDEPDGTVTISSPDSVEFGSDSCELITTPGIRDRTRCEIRFMPLLPPFGGKVTIKAEYQGDYTRHAISPGQAEVQIIQLPE